MNLSIFADNTTALTRCLSGPGLKSLNSMYLLDNYNHEGVPYIDTVSSHAGRKQGRKLVCHLCQGEITDESWRVDFMGRNLHSRTNPAGYSYTFACFSDAPGCNATGQAITEHSWFAGHAWQVALCGHCGEHLGWLFRGRERCFGLIQGRVIPGRD